MIIKKYIKIRKGSILNLKKINFKEWSKNEDNYNIKYCTGIFDGEKGYQKYCEKMYDQHLIFCKTFEILEQEKSMRIMGDISLEIKI